MCWTGLLPVDHPVGWPSQKSIGRAVDRCAHICTAKGRSTAQSTARKPLLSENGPVDQTVDRWVICLAMIDRLVDRWHNGQKSDHWPIDRAVDRQQSRLLIWTPTANFWRPIYWGSLGLFYIRFQKSFWASFSYLFQWFPPHVLEPIFQIKRRVLSRGFQKWFFEFFTTCSILVFLTHN